MSKGPILMDPRGIAGSKLLKKIEKEDCPTEDFTNLCPVGK